MTARETLSLICAELRDRIAETERNNAGDAYWSPTLDDINFAQTRVKAFKEVLLFIEGMMTWETVEG